MKLLLLEIYKVFMRRRSYIAFVAIFIIAVLLLLAVHYQGNAVISFLTANLKEAFTFQGSLINANLFAHVVLKSLWVHIPMLVIMVTGDLISSEYQTGSFRMVLSRPVSRFSIITSKFIAGFFYVILLILFMALLSLGIGHIFWGDGDMLVTNETLNIFNANDTLWRFALAYSFGILSMLTVASLAMLFSTIFENSVSAILTSLTIVIVLTFLSTFNIPFLISLKPFLFTTYMGGWQSFFYFNIDYHQVLLEVVILLVHIFGFYAISLFLFFKKDILN